jgi:DNA segregation ATPase FtsK/SpoIIIE-like protein
VIALGTAAMVGLAYRDAITPLLGPVGVWVAVAGLVTTGVRLLMGHAWHVAWGSLAAVLGAIGTVAAVHDGAGGQVGQGLVDGLALGLTVGGAAIALVVITVLGLVLAVDLRLNRVASLAWAHVGQRGRQAAHAVCEWWAERSVPLVTAATTPRPAATSVDPPSTHDDAGGAVEGDGDVARSDGAAGGTSPWRLPSSALLADTADEDREQLDVERKETRSLIETTLASFGVVARVIDVNSGPAVTQYELQPALGVPVRKIVGHQTDLSLALAAPIRIQAPIPGKAAIGIEVPNKAAQLVTLRSLVQSPAFRGATRSRLAVALGADVSGQPVVGDLARMPHLLIAGATGSGKSVCLNAILAGLLLQATPEQLRLILIDPKRVELSGFADIPHLLVPVVVEPEAAVAALRLAVREMQERYKLFAAHRARNIASFNERAPQLGLTSLPNIVVLIDELADLMMVAAGEIEDLICRIAQLARAVGIHLVVATQRPSADIITGLIKANIPSRIAFAVSSGVDSRVILDEMGAEKLLGRGDMLYLPIDQGKARRLQGAYVSDRELEQLIESWKAQGRPDYQLGIAARRTDAADLGEIHALLRLLHGAGDLRVLPGGRDLPVQGQGVSIAEEGGLDD